MQRYHADNRPTARAAWAIAVIGLSFVGVVTPRTLGQAKKPTANTSPPKTVKHRNARPAISADGNVIVFQSTSLDIVPGDTSGTRHIYAFDRATNIMMRVSANNSGKPGNKQSFGASISADGRYVAFVSDATNLVPGDTNNKQDVFVRDRQKGTTVRLSVTNSGEQANNESHDAAISPDGRFVAFASTATNFDTNDINKSADIFLCDRESKFLHRITIANDGIEADHGSGEPSVSTDGHYVAFYSHASNLTPVDTNRAPDIYVYDSFTRTMEIVSVASNRMIGNRDSRRPSISADGRFVVFESWASDLVGDDKNDVPDIFLRDRESKKTICVSRGAEGIPANDDSRDPRISNDGNFIIYTSYASNLVAGDTNNLSDVFVYDRKTRKTERMNLTHKGEQAGNRSGEGALSADGKLVVFTSKASNLIEGDTNKSLDIFLVDRKEKRISRISVPANKKDSP